MAAGITPVTGTVRTTTLVNLRHGAPRISAPVVGKLAAGTVVAVTSVAVGDSVQGNALWYGTTDQNFLWSGGCDALQTGAAGTIGGSAVRPRIPMVVDVYHRSIVRDLAVARAAGVQGIIHKATTGTSGRDELYDDRRIAARKAGLLWGAYHWGTALPPAQQVENFLGWSKPDDRTLVALDYEPSPNNQMTLEGAREFLERIQERLGRRAVLYSGHLIKEELGTRIDPFFGAHRLWLAQYSATASVQPSWKSYWLWQYSDGAATVPGIPGDGAGHVDQNYYDGPAEQLAAEWAS
ncbi:GH25 family lysozyme M1 (1,4-beta-N-acetylmuramidase) [Sphingomonas trueperi]|uniref:glycoside hydrolase family 25 protein n=1 Tax=Sphingomonas trueperi TaxID=53317 RepID=UPI00339428F5